MDQPEQQKPQSNETLGSFLWDLVKILVIALVIIIPVRYYVAQPFIVEGSSMVPTFHDGEYLIVNELSFRMHKLDRGDIVVFKYPKDTSQYFIKRVIGLPGEKVQIKDNQVIVYNTGHLNGFPIDEKYLPTGTQTLAVGQDPIVTLGSDEYFVLGDNRQASSDSRFWGPVPSNDVVGKVGLRLYPFSTWTLFHHTSYNQ